MTTLSIHVIIYGRKCSDNTADLYIKRDILIKGFMIKHLT